MLKTIHGVKIPVLCTPSDDAFYLCFVKISQRVSELQT